MFERFNASLSRAIVAMSCLLMVAAVTAAHVEQPFMTLAERGTGAWWLDAEFHPFTMEVRGIPAKKINKSWCKATEFRKDLLPREIVIEENGGDSMEGYSFALEDNFDSSARKQIALVGVYEDCSGKTGRFFMIADGGCGQRWHPMGHEWRQARRATPRLGTDRTRREEPG